MSSKMQMYPVCLKKLGWGTEDFNNEMGRLCNKTRHKLKKKVTMPSAIPFEITQPSVIPTDRIYNLPGGLNPSGIFRNVLTPPSPLHAGPSSLRGSHGDAK